MIDFCKRCGRYHRLFRHNKPLFHFLIHKITKNAPRHRPQEQKKGQPQRKAVLSVSEYFHDQTPYSFFSLYEHSDFAILSNSFLLRISKNSGNCLGICHLSGIDHIQQILYFPDLHIDTLILIQMLFRRNQILRHEDINCLVA